jgi:hypothetical protein
MRIMRRSALIAVLLTGCVVNVGGSTGGDDNTGDDQNPTPKLDVSVDKDTVATELGKMDMVTFTLTGSGGFGEDVQLAATLTDATSMPVTAITMTGPTTLTVPQNGSATATYMLTSTMNASGADIAATLNLAVTSTLGPASKTSAINLAAVYSVHYTDGTGVTVANHPLRAMALTLKRGAILRIYNDDNSAQHVTHADGVWPHQDPRNDPTTALAGTHYDINTNIAPVGSTGSVGCHTHEAPTDYWTLTTE